MKLTLEGTPKEVADLVSRLQSQLVDGIVRQMVNGVREAICDSALPPEGQHG